jgi:hypothetical protein
MINGKTDKLPAFIGMTILTAALGVFAYDPPHC